MLTLRAAQTQTSWHRALRRIMAIVALLQREGSNIRDAAIGDLRRFAMTHLHHTTYKTKLRLIQQLL